MFACVQHTQSLFGPAGLAFMRMAAHMDHVGQPMKLLYGVNGHGGGPFHKSKATLLFAILLL